MRQVWSPLWSHTGRKHQKHLPHTHLSRHKHGTPEVRPSRVAFTHMNSIHLRTNKCFIRACVNLAPLGSCVTNAMISSVGITPQQTDARAPVLCYCWHGACVLLMSGLLKIKRPGWPLLISAVQKLSHLEVSISSAPLVFCCSMCVIPTVIHRDESTPGSISLS